MPKTIIYKGRLITVTMEKPEDKDYYHGNTEGINMHYRDTKDYINHLESLWQSSTIHASKELMERFKDGEELPDDSCIICPVMNPGGHSVDYFEAVPIVRNSPLPAVEEGSQDEVRDKLRHDLKEKFGF